MQWFFDGKLVYDTMRNGNASGHYAVENHIFSTDVTAGEHALAVMVKSGSAGWSVVSPGPDTSVLLNPNELYWWFRWNTGPDGTTTDLSCDYEFLLGRSNELAVSLTLPEDTKTNVYATIDGKEKHLATDVAGTDLL